MMGSCILNNKKNLKNLTTCNINKFCQNFFEIGSETIHYKKMYFGHILMVGLDGEWHTFYHVLEVANVMMYC